MRLYYIRQTFLSSLEEGLGTGLKPNKWRLIVDLSAPEGHSINDGISKELASLSYVSVDDVVACTLKEGKGALLAKMDVKQAYRNIPVHPSDRACLGMSWEF